MGRIHLTTEQLIVLSRLFDGDRLIYRASGARSNGSQGSIRWYLGSPDAPDPTHADPTGLDRFTNWEPGRDAAWGGVDGRAVKALLSRGLLSPITRDRATSRGPVPVLAGAEITEEGRVAVEEERTGRVDLRTRGARAERAVQETVQQVEKRGLRVWEVVDALKSTAKVVEVIQAAYESAGGPPLEGDMLVAVNRAQEVARILSTSGSEERDYVG
jgi:hypothetical protein